MRLHQHLLLDCPRPNTLPYPLLMLSKGTREPPLVLLWQVMLVQLSQNNLIQFQRWKNSKKLIAGNLGEVSKGSSKNFHLKMSIPIGIHATGIVTYIYIYHKKSTIHVGKYTSPMDPIGYANSPSITSLCFEMNHCHVHKILGPSWKHYGSIHGKSRKIIMTSTWQMPPCCNFIPWFWGLPRVVDFCPNQGSCEPSPLL